MLPPPCKGACGRDVLEAMAPKGTLHLRSVRPCGECPTTSGTQQGPRVLGGQAWASVQFLSALETTMPYVEHQVATAGKSLRGTES